MMLVSIMTQIIKRAGKGIAATDGAGRLEEGACDLHRQISIRKSARKKKLSEVAQLWVDGHPTLSEVTQLWVDGHPTLSEVTQLWVVGRPTEIGHPTMTVASCPTVLGHPTLTVTGCPTDWSPNRCRSPNQMYHSNQNLQISLLITLKTYNNISNSHKIQP